MSKLEQLIQELCPNGVEYGTLGDLTIKAYSGGTPLANNSQYYGGDIPWLRTQEVRFVDIHDTKIKITPMALANSSAKWIPENCVIIAISGATAGRSAINKIALTTNQHCCCLEINPKKAIYRYVFHWVYCQYENIKALGRGAREDLNASIIKGYPIPIPPLPIQEEIVRILDKFNETQTELINQLQSELTARKQQYEYCRDSLLTFGDDVGLQPLGKVTIIKRGVRVVKKQLAESGKYPVYQNSLTPLGYFDKSNCFANITFMISAGAAGSVGYSSVEFWAADDCYYFNQSEKLQSRYLYHVLLSQQNYIFSSVRKASIPRLGRDIVEKLPIPIPPLLEQERIVTILDNLDSQITELTQKLSEEIKARKQQYEYYRDTLLTFKEL